MAVNNPDPNAEPNADPSQTFSLEYVQSLRKESAGYRTRAKVLEGQLAKVGDAPATIRRLSVDLELAQRGDVDPKLTKFFLSEEGQLDDLDVSVEGWQDVLNDRVSDLAARNPQVKARRGPPVVRSGNPTQSPGPGGPTSSQLTRGDLAHMRPEQVEDALKRGDLDQILGRG